MKNCTNCRYAEWMRTKANTLHPSGEGRCTKEVQIPQLPPAFYFLTRPSICRGNINRRKELNDHCPYYQVDPEAP